MSLDAAHHHADTKARGGGVNTLPADQSASGDRIGDVGGNTLDGGHMGDDTQTTYAPVSTLPTAKTAAFSKWDPPSADFPPGHQSSAAQPNPAGGDLPADQWCLDAQNKDVGGTTLPAATTLPTPTIGAPLATPLTDGQDGHDTQTSITVGNPHDALLLILADALDDLERTRITTQNRLRSLEQVKGLADSREARTMQHIADTLAGLEHQATLDLQRAMRAHPLGPWVKRTVGIGEKQGARLIAAIGDPAARKMPSQLWQYCGHGAPSKREKGVKSWWNPTAKMRLYLIADRCITKTGEPDKNGKPTPLSPYRAVYDNARTDWAARTECATCKSDACSDGHKHNHALRMVGKAILLDLWREAKELAA